MVQLLIRLALLALVGGGAWLLVRLWERRGGPAFLPLAAGLTLVTGPGCGLCGPVERALVLAGVKPMIAEVGTIDLPGSPIQSLPIAIVVDSNGIVVMRRSGKAALEDAKQLAACASDLNSQVD